MKKARVIKQHISEFAQPLILTEGDRVICVEKPTNWEGWVYCPNFNGIDGWIPKSFLKFQEKTQYFVLRDNTLLEMEVEINDILVGLG